MRYKSLAISYLLLIAPLVTSAQGFNICPQNASPGECVNNFYKFALLISGVLAFGAIVYGGIKYTFAAGNPSGQSEGKEWVKSALLGLLLLGAAGLILRTINPKLVDLSLAELPGLPAPAPGPAPTPAPSPSGACSLAPLAPITDPEALAMENGAKVVWTSSDANVQKNLTKLQREFNKLQSLMTSKVGGSATVNSVYRPYAYQFHLFDIFMASQVYLGNKTFYDNQPACSSVIAALKAEQQKHGICSGSGPCLVAPPSRCAPHVKGTGIDISISPAAFLTTINTFLQNNNIDLRWQALSSDPVHFNLQNPPFTGCAP